MHAPIVDLRQQPAPLTTRPGDASEIVNGEIRIEVESEANAGDGVPPMDGFESLESEDVDR